MKSLDRQSLDDQTRLVPRYVAGDLSRSERSEFEAWLVASPELAAEVEMERRLRRGIASAARRGWLNRGTAAPLVRNRPWRVALAASLLISLAIGWSFLMPREASQPAAATRAPLVARASVTVHLSAFRGASSEPDYVMARKSPPAEIVFEADVVALTCEGGAVEFECPGGAPPQTPQYPEYELEVVSSHGAVSAWHSTRQIPVVGSPLLFTMPDPGILDAGDYDIVVHGHSPTHDEVVKRFFLRVTE